MDKLRDYKETAKTFFAGSGIRSPGPYREKHDVNSSLGLFKPNPFRRAGAPSA